MERRFRHPLIRRERRPRAHLRGAAMTEALVVLPFMFLILCLSLFAARLYGGTAGARNEARHAAWSYALNACEGESAEGVGSDQIEEPVLDLVADEPMVPPDAMSSPEEDDHEFLDNARRSGEGVELGDSWGVARATIERGPVYAHVLPMFRSTTGPETEFPVRASFEVQCNEKARGANPLDVLRFIWSLRDTLNLELQ